MNEISKTQPTPIRITQFPTERYFKINGRNKYTFQISFNVHDPKIPEHQLALIIPVPIRHTTDTLCLIQPSETQYLLHAAYPKHQNRKYLAICDPKPLPNTTISDHQQIQAVAISPGGTPWHITHHEHDTLIDWVLRNDHEHTEKPPAQNPSLLY